MACGCATVATQSEISSLAYGPYPNDYETVIKAYYMEFLFDPNSAQYEFSQPMLVSYKEEPLEGGRILGGYLVVVKVTAKNRMREYAGQRTEGFLTQGWADNQTIRRV